MLRQQSCTHPYFMTSITRCGTRDKGVATRPPVLRLAVLWNPELRIVIAKGSWDHLAMTPVSPVGLRIVTKSMPMVDKSIQLLVPN